MKKVDKKVKIDAKVYRDILSVCPTVPPETGGFLGQHDGVICRFVYDKGSLVMDRGIYEVNTELLSETIRQWERENIHFCGILHTHLPGESMLSSGDFEYIYRIMEANAKIVRKLYFPIVIPGEKLIMYQAVCKNSGLEIMNKKIVLCGRRKTMKNKEFEMPQGQFFGHNCSDGCVYWRPGKRDGNGRQYCAWYDSYYYPRERQGCLSYK